MNDELTADQQALLRAELERILARLEQSMKVTQETLRPAPLDQTSVGRLSRMDTLQNQGLTRNLQEREQRKLGAVVSALARLDRGEYGRCTDCGAAIGFERLMVFPETPTCQSCGPTV
jgi:DnaK suppressor protein